MKTISVVVLSALLVACVGERRLPVRMDPVQRAGLDRHLDGLRVAVRSVRDKRPDHDAIGRHRDGFLRMVQYRYVGRESIETTIEAAMQRALEDAGATVVDASAHADFVLDVDVVAFDVTSDAPLAGEETFGVVGIDARVASGERVLGHAAVTWPFAIDGIQDPGIVGDALQRAAQHVVRSLRRPSQHARLTTPLASPHEDRPRDEQDDADDA